MKSFDEVYEQYADMLFKIAFMYFGNTADSEDAVQEVFISYFRHSSPFKSETHEKAWLIRATQNRCRNMLKSPSRRACALENLSLAQEEPDRELHLDTLGKVVALPSSYKTVILLYYYYGCSVAEIAQTLKISQSAVKMRLKRGRALLKKELEGYENV
ncbi:MAG: RNA polymerase sigma factor [Eubacterium sp.]|nr:RNA polymerase sigma factor [Eubacterium sp.]